jgi:hypothetical protein
MTKKHFNALAQSLYHVKPTLNLSCPSCDHTFPANDLGKCPECGGCEANKDPRHGEWLSKLCQWERDVQAIRYVCQCSNSNFQPSRFVEACENGL